MSRFFASPYVKGFVGALAALAFAGLCARMYQTDQLARASVGWINAQIAAQKKPAP